MSVLTELFAEFPEFVDYRQDQLLDVMRAIQTLKDVKSDDPTALIRTISNLDLPRLHTMYNNKCNEVRRGNSQLMYAIRDASFIRFKSVLGADDYV